jgi:hypothetical protein
VPIPATLTISAALDAEKVDQVNPDDRRVGPVHPVGHADYPAGQEPYDW